MGTITKGILGGFSGTVGTIVGANWRGKDIISSRPKSSSRRASEKQLAQQAKFKLVMQFLRPISGIQKKYFGNKSGVLSRTNLAASYTITEAIVMNGDVPELVFSKVMITKGELTGFQNPTVDAQTGNNLIFSWDDNTLQGNAKPDDILGVACYCDSEKEFVIFENVAERSAVSANLNLPAHFAGKTLEVFAFFNTKDESSASNSVYLGSKTII